MSFLSDIKHSKIDDFARTFTSEIQVKSGKCRYNFRCQHNAVHEALKRKDNRIAIVFYKHKSWSHYYLHFLNVSVKEKYTDNTLGRNSKYFNYRFIKYVEVKDFNRIDDIFEEVRLEICKNLPYFIKLLTNSEI